jgi:hypothetical protein
MQTQIKCPSLWLRPSRGTTKKIPLACFKDYPYFFESFEQYGMKLPAVLVIHWKSITPYLMPFSDEGDKDPHWIREITKMIKTGEPVPPILIEPDGALFDGRHRAWAAHNLGLKTVPTTVIK